jgi:hypothetical protein
VGVNKMTGVPWHIEKLHLDENDKRRNKNRCIFYDRSSGLCFSRKLKCIGSAHCEKYKEEKIIKSPINKKAKWRYTTHLIAINKKEIRKGICPFCNTRSLKVKPLNCVIFDDDKKTKFVGTVEDAFCRCCEVCGKKFISVETLNYFTGGRSLEYTNLKVDFFNQDETNG